MNLPNGCGRIAIFCSAVLKDGDFLHVGEATHPQDRQRKERRRWSQQKGRITPHRLMDAGKPQFMAMQSISPTISKCFYRDASVCVFRFALCPDAQAMPKSSSDRDTTSSPGPPSHRTCVARMTGVSVVLLQSDVASTLPAEGVGQFRFHQCSQRRSHQQALAWKRRGVGTDIRISARSIG